MWHTAAFDAPPPLTSLLGPACDLYFHRFVQFFRLLERACASDIVDVRIKASYDKSINRGTLAVDVLLLAGVSI